MLQPRYEPAGLVARRVMPWLGWLLLVHILACDVPM